MKKIQSLKGMHDILPSQTPVWQFVERCVADVLAVYGYQEIRMPILEYTDLFKRSIGEVTDIVEKEMYSFDDRHGDSVSLRPEGTAACVRACEQHGLLYNQVQKVWYSGPMFRYERPQKGRQRQFHQFGLEAFGMPGPDIDAEMLMLTNRLWQKLGCDSVVTLELNNLGTVESRAKYREALVEYLSKYESELDADSQSRLHRNPLRILDSKNEHTQALLNDAPDIKDYLSEASTQHFSKLCALLDAAGVNYQINQRLVRGLDYYSDTVFEWVTNQLGAQGTVCAGGRYDGLVAQLGGKSTPAIGCGMGVERLVLLVEALGAMPDAAKAPLDVYVIYEDCAMTQAYVIAEKLRNQNTQLKCWVHAGGGSIKSQIKKANNSGASAAIIIGEAEVAKDSVAFKPLRGQGEQQHISVKEGVQALATALSTLTH